MDLFEHSRQEQIRREAPLAARMRPRTLDEFIGQEQIIGPGRLLRRAIESDRLFSSILFWGPPGVGKTTLAAVIANTTAAHFETLNAVLAGVADLRKLVEAARERRAMYGKRTLLMVDEIHRWNKAQQDGLLPVVEDGTITLIGATTENPFFSIIGPLLSRSRIFHFQALTVEQIMGLLENALHDGERGYGNRAIVADEEALHHLADLSDGDVRTALNALELAVESTAPGEDGVRHITLAVAEESIQQRAMDYDRSGDEHYNTVSAFIKSIRGSDPDAALYYLAKMVAAGEDPRFIFRRLIIAAAEDVGLASPMAISVVMACAQAFEWVGMPEGQFHLAEATLYLATVAKSNSASAYWEAREYLETHGYRPPPLYLRDKNTLLKGERAQPVSYKYPHDYPGGWVKQRYLPEGVPGGWYRPKNIGYEQKIAEYLNKLKGNSSE
ncbi:MAG: replication-associated recombination protein A [Anaerolineae bacterium]|nr:replication-associated recombination protein A [Anaerolineae bacterium]